MQNRPAPIHLDNDTTPRRPSGLAKRLPYRKADYSNIRYWTRKNYNDTRNENAQVIIHDAAAETTSLPFMEHEDGTTLTDEEAIKMCATARGVFAHFMQEGSAPAKWGQISVIGQDFFFNAIVELHPHAAMCEDMWKAQLLATTCYPSWHRNNKVKIERRKQEILWRQQQMEHGRQLKEELIENVEHVEGKSKHDRPMSDVSDMAQTKPPKKAKATNSRAGSSLSGMPRASWTASVPLNSASQHSLMPIPSLASQSGPAPSLESAGQWEPMSAPLTLAALVHSHGQSAPAPSTMSEPSASSDSESQCVLAPEPSTMFVPSASFNSESQREQTLPLVLSDLPPHLDNCMYDRTELDNTSTFNMAMDGLDTNDSMASPNIGEQHTTQDTAFSSASLLSESTFADPPSLEAGAHLGETNAHEMQETPFSSEPILSDPTVEHGAHLSAFTSAPSLDAGMQHETQATHPSEFPSPDSWDSSRQQAASPGVLDAQEATAETLLSLRHEELSIRPRPVPHCSDPTVPLDFDSTFDKNARKVSVRNPL